MLLLYMAAPANVLRRLSTRRREWHNLPATLKDMVMPTPSARVPVTHSQSSLGTECSSICEIQRR